MPAALGTLGRATGPDGVGAPAGTRRGTGEPTLDPQLDPLRGDTCHLDVADAAGNVVSATPSGGWLQSSPTVPGLGLQLSTRAQMLWLEPGLPTSMAPGVRPRTTLSPTLVVGPDGVLACGTPGGDQQDQWQVPFLVNHLVHGMGLQEAIDAPTWHTTRLVSSFDPRTVGGALHAESRLGADVLADLEARGHEVVDAGPWSLGRLSAVSFRDDGTLRAAANPRGMQGYAVGR
jgi:gamma-glutamyltranspeptidase/glutathione hydrolase